MTVTWVYFQPTRIDLHALELTGDVYAEDGSHGTVTVPIDVYEHGSFTTIIESASKRAIDLVNEVVRRR